MRAVVQRVAWAKVEVDGANVRVKRLVSAFECGAVLNPDHLSSQIEGTQSSLQDVLAAEARIYDDTRPSDVDDDAAALFVAVDRLPPRRARCADRAIPGIAYACAYVYAYDSTVSARRSRSG